MKKSWIAAAVAALAVLAGVYYMARPKAPAPAALVAGKTAVTPAPKPPQPQLTSRSVVEPSAKPASSDPRLAALMASPGNALVEYFSDPEGRVMKEVDKDPASPGFGKPLREYTYAGKQVVQVVSYRYHGDQVQVVTALITYKPDGSVDQFRETTRGERRN